MHYNSLKSLEAEISDLRRSRPVGRVSAVEDGALRIIGFAEQAHLGDRVRIHLAAGAPITGEIIRLDRADATVMPEGSAQGVSVGARVTLWPAAGIAPSDAWIGRVVDPYGQPLDNMGIFRGEQARDLRSSPPPPAQRRPMGQRLETGMAAFNTFLPIARGQRVGLFAGSGVGKSSLMGSLGRGVEADVVVVALIGERGREIPNFVTQVLGAEGMKRAVVVAASSDQPALVRRRCAWTAMAVAEHFRDQGKHVLLMADSVTRFAEAHREVATAAGEMPVLRGYPASTAHMLMSLCERAGPGAGMSGDITALFSVLVAGSDMDEPIADILRGVLDGHIVLDRDIADRGRYPAIDLLKSVSRSLPEAASEDENMQLLQARRLMGLYAKSEAMVRAGLYSEGSDPELDRAVRAWPDLDQFLSETGHDSAETSFGKLGLILRRSGAQANVPKPVR